MPKPDMDEIEMQANEMVKAGLAAEFSGNDFPRWCSLTMLVEKEKINQKRQPKAKECASNTAN